MGMTAEFIAEQYEVLKKLENNKNNTTELLLKKGTSQIYVRKEIDGGIKQIAIKLRSLNNIHVIRPEIIYAVNEKNYVIYPYVAGSTLEEILETNSVIDETKAEEYMYQLLDGLEAMHSMGIVHRDITPANVVITNEGILKVLDFGISREETPGKHKDTQILGTEGYAAPEQFGFRQTDIRTDIYAAGVLYNQMLTGCFPGEKITDDYYAKKIISKATSLDPKDRYEDASAMKNAIFKKRMNQPENTANAENKNRAENTDRSGKWIAWRNENLPGFRTGIKWKKILGRLIYGAMLFLFTIYLLDSFNPKTGGGIKEIVSAFLVVIISPLVGANFCNWDKKVFILPEVPYFFRLFIRITLAIVLFYVGAEMYVGVPRG